MEGPRPPAGRAQCVRRTSLQARGAEAEFTDGRSKASGMGSWFCPSESLKDVVFQPVYREFFNHVTECDAPSPSGFLERARLLFKFFLV